MIRSCQYGRNSDAKMFFECKIFCRTDALNKMHTGMTRAADPHALAEIQVGPVMIDQFHWAVALAQFTAFISWIGALILHATVFLPVAIAYSMLPHVSSGRRTRGTPIPLAIFQVSFYLACLTAVAETVGSRFVFVKQLFCDHLFAAITAVMGSWLQSLDQPSTLDGAASPLDFMGWRRQECLSAVSASHLHLAIVPRAHAFGEYISSHGA